MRLWSEAILNRRKKASNDFSCCNKGSVNRAPVSLLFFSRLVRPPNFLLRFLSLVSHHRAAILVNPPIVNNEFAAESSLRLLSPVIFIFSLYFSRQQILAVGSRWSIGLAPIRTDTRRRDLASSVPRPGSFIMQIDLVKW